MFDAFEICGVNDWQIVRTGPVRDGAFGRLTPPEAEVGRCGGYGAERFAEAFCHDDSIYTENEYRSLLREGLDAECFFADHDVMQLQNLKALWPESARGKWVADVGCAAGSFFDHIYCLAAKTIAIEPCGAYQNLLHDLKPGGPIPLPHLGSPLLNSFWQSYIEQEGSGDYQYFSLARAG